MDIQLLRSLQPNIARPAFTNEEYKINYNSNTEGDATEYTTLLQLHTRHKNIDTNRNHSEHHKTC